MPELMTRDTIGGTMEILTGDEAVAEGGSLKPRRLMTDEYRERVADAWVLFENAAGGSALAKHQLLEAITQSDFPLMFAAAIDTKLLAAYEAISPVWSMFATRDVVPDFRLQTWIDLLGGQGALSHVPENAPYPRAKIAEGAGSYGVAKYGNSIGLTWEMWVNDRLNAFRQLPGRLAVAAREMEDRIATGLLAVAAGPNSALFGAAKVLGPNGATSSNLIAANPALSEAALENAVVAIGQRRDYDNRPVVVNAAVLVVPPALAITAERIVGATEVRETIGAKTIVRTNPMAGRVKVAVNPWLPTIDVSANVNTTWYLVPDPMVNPRPAVVLAFLAGHETPDLRVKNDQGTRVGGGSIAPEEGSYEFDTIDYRVRHVLGGGSVDAIATAVSNGSGS